jgi:hypothetical protein
MGRVDLDRGAHPVVRLRGAEEEVGLPQAPDALRQLPPRVGPPERGCQLIEVSLQLDRLAAFPGQHPRVGRDQLDLGRDQLLRTALLDGEQDR